MSLDIQSATAVAALILNLAGPGQAIAENSPRGSRGPQDDGTVIGNLDRPGFTATAAPAMVGDGLGSHAAAMDLQMNGFDIDGAGSIHATAYFHLSDARSKTGIIPLGPGLVADLSPVIYILKGEDRQRMGFLAQDIAGVMPGAVAETADGTLMVDYLQIIAPLVAEVQDLRARIALLEAERGAE